ncbi:MAG: hypothetical protein AB1831_00850 [Pseudomonadota bacterium]
MPERHQEYATPAQERRQRPDLRAIFDEVLNLVAPFIQHDGDSHEYWAGRAVRDAYPDLDDQGLQIVLVAAIRVCRQRQADAGH